MIAATAWFLLGLLLLALGGDSIVKAASGLAQRFGASPFVAGLLLVAFGTSRDARVTARPVRNHATHPRLRASPVNRAFPRDHATHP